MEEQEDLTISPSGNPVHPGQGNQPEHEQHSSQQPHGYLPGLLAHSPFTRPSLQNLAVDMDTEGRYLFLNCITNQLRYPNSHTHYFSCCLLYLFAEANTEAIQEQVKSPSPLLSDAPPRSDHPCAAGAPDRESPPPLGPPHHLH